MTVIDSMAFGRSDAQDVAVRWEYEAGVARIVIGGTLTDEASAAAREMLLDACEQGTAGVILALETELDPANPDALRHLVDVAQRRCWAASRRLEVTATDHGVCEILASAGIWPSRPARAPIVASDEVAD